MTRSSFQSALEEILDVPPGSLQESDTRDTVAGWTSVADIQILATVSGEFGIEADGELIEAETVRDLLDALEARGAFRS
jgi:acyl carrier protein